MFTALSPQRGWNNVGGSIDICRIRPAPFRTCSHGRWRLPLARFFPAFSILHLSPPKLWRSSHPATRPRYGTGFAFGQAHVGMLAQPTCRCDAIYIISLWISEATQRCDLAQTLVGVWPVISVGKGKKKPGGKGGSGKTFPASNLPPHLAFADSAFVVIGHATVWLAPTEAIR